MFLKLMNSGLAKPINADLFDGCTSRANTAPLQNVCVEMMGVMTGSLKDRGSVNFPIPTRDFEAPNISPA